MQLANASVREAFPAPAVVLGLCEDPQAVSVSTHPTARQTVRVGITRQV
jgi:hypothetical protein